MGSSIEKIGQVEEWYEPCLFISSKYLEIGEDRVVAGDMIRVRVLGPKDPMPWNTVLMLIYNRLVDMGCFPRLIKNNDGIFLLIRKSGKNMSKRKLAILLAILTLASVYVSGLGILLPGVNVGIPNTALGYLMGLLIPLFVHELGHWITLRKYKTPASIPYLLPAPPIQAGFLGTFGAVINLRWLPPSDRALALSAIMGPLAGFLAALPFAVWGIKASVIMPAAAAKGTIPLVPLIFLLIPPPKPLGPHEVLVLSPMGFAAFIVFFVTFLNLIPVATLDGGHIVRALLGYKGHKIVSKLALILLGVATLKWPMLGLFTIIAIYFYLKTKQGHPGSAMGIHNPRDPVLALVGIIYGLLLLLTMPIPV